MMVNNQAADEPAANLPAVTGESEATEALSETSSRKPRRISSRDPAIDETAQLGVVEESAGGMGRNAASLSSLPEIISRSSQSGVQRGVVAGGDELLASRNEPRASVTTIGGAQPSVSSPTPSSYSAARPVSSEAAPADDVGRLLGARSLMRLMLIEQHATMPSQQSAAGQFRDRVAELGHVVELVMAEGWQRQVAQDPPEVIVFAPGLEVSNSGTVDEAAISAALQTCRTLKSQSENAGCLLAVLLDGRQSTLDAQAWSSWQSAGADVFMESDVSAALLQSSLESWARLVRLQRDATLLRDTLGRQVQFDDLTQLLNRRFFFQSAHREVSRARRYNNALSCLMIDVNHFKLYNKTFGYGCGDHILRTVAATIRAWTRESDILARFGAKKFVILLPETDVEGAMMLHEKLQHALSDSAFTWEGQTLPLTISIGEAERRRDQEIEAANQNFPTPEDELRVGSEGDDNTPLSIREELADLLEAADAALYVAKKGVRYPNFPLVPRQSDEVSGILGAA